MRPLSLLRPKPLCPVGFDTLLESALGRVAAALGPAARLAVNLCHGAEQIERFLASGRWHERVHRSVEAEALGTAGAVAPLRSWLDGRGLLIVNGDTWCPAGLDAFVEAWDGVRVAVAVSGPPPLHGRSGVVASILPWSDVREVPPRPAGLWELFWRDRLAAGELQSVGVDGPFVDCATVADYLRANLLWLAGTAGTASTVGADGGLVARHDSAEIGRSARLRDVVIGAGAVVDGELTRCVVWPGARVEAGEVLADCVRTPDGQTISAGGSVPGR